MTRFIYKPLFSFRRRSFLSALSFQIFRFIFPAFPFADLVTFLHAFFARYPVPFARDFSFLKFLLFFRLHSKYLQNTVRKKLFPQLTFESSCSDFFVSNLNTSFVALESFTGSFLSESTDKCIRFRTSSAYLNSVITKFSEILNISGEYSKIYPYGCGLLR